jgi:hypothetical protein
MASTFNSEIGRAKHEINELAIRFARIQCKSNFSNKISDRFSEGKISRVAPYTRIKMEGTIGQ